MTGIRQHAWVASDKPLAFMYAGFHENESPRPALWMRMYEPEWLARWANETEQVMGYSDLPLGVLKDKHALESFVRFMDSIFNQVSRLELPQPTERGADEKDSPST